MSTTPEEPTNELSVKELSDALGEMKASMSSVREVVKSLKQKVDSSEMDMKDGISLLSIKSNVMLSYLQSLVLLSARRVVGHSLTEREPPRGSFATPDRGARGSGLGDRVDSMIESRVVLEKVKVLEGRMRYQIEKLVRVAEEAPEASQNVVNDPLAFRPNPQDLLNQEMSSEDEEEDGSDGEETTKDGVYRPPKLAPMPYIEPQKNKDKTRRGPVPSALTSLAHLDPSMPHVESTSGLGSTPALMSNRARELKRMTEFEEENMTRLVMKKKDAQRRRQDEADIALGGIGVSGRRSRGGLEDEFDDILKSVGRRRSGVVGDGYEELRQKGKKDNVLARSRVRSRESFADTSDDGPRQRKRSRFEREVKASKKRMSVKSRK